MVYEAQLEQPSAREARAPSSGQCQEVNSSVNIPRMHLKVGYFAKCFSSSCPLAMVSKCPFHYIYFFNNYYRSTENNKVSDVLMRTHSICGMWAGEKSTPACAKQNAIMDRSSQLTNQPKKKVCAL